MCRSRCLRCGLMLRVGTRVTLAATCICLQVPASCKGVAAPCNTVPSLPSACDKVVVVKNATSISDFEVSTTSAARLPARQRLQ